MREVYALSDALRALAALRRIAEKQGNNHLANLANALQYSFAIQRDLCILRTDVITERDRWRRNLYARNLAILLVDFLDRIDKVLGKDFKSHIEAAAGSHAPELLTKYHDVRKGLDDICEQYKKQLRQIRNTAAAHREPHANVQLESIDNVDETAIIVVAQAVQMWQWLILSFWRGLVQKLFASQWKEAKLSLYQRMA